MEAGRRATGNVVAPHRVDQAVDGHHATARQQQRGQYRALLRRSDVDVHLGAS
jgi:hypothetical protein